MESFVRTKRKNNGIGCLSQSLKDVGSNPAKIVEKPFLIVSLSYLGICLLGNFFPYLCKKLRSIFVLDECIC